MTPDSFRKIALSLPDAEERSHMNHPDFRIGGRIFATLGYPNDEYAMVKLTPEQQQNHVDMNPKAFIPVKGAWGRQGCTNVHLKSAKSAEVRKALKIALEANRKPKK